jgi:site-specific DNA-methyltransferase (adenine-specific)
MKEFRKDIGDLTSLKESIQKHGLIHPIVYDSNGVLIAGRRRRKACEELGITPDHIVIDFDDPDRAQIDENVERKDFTITEINEISKYINEREAKKANQYTKVPCSDSERSKPIEVAAKITGKSTDTISKINQICEKGNEELIAKVDAKEISVNEAYKTIKKEEKQQKFDKNKEEFNKEPEQSEVKTTCFNGDALEFLKSYSGDKFDLVLTDPPYAMDFKSGWNDWEKVNNDKRSDTLPLLDSCFKMLTSHMKDNAHIYVFGNPNEIENVKPIFCKYFNLVNILVWDREVIGMGNLKTYGRSYDVIYFGYLKTWKDLNGTRDRDILKFSRVAPNNLTHPTEKPAELLEYLIKKSSNENELVLDCFAGSCSTLKSANKLNRNSIGCELETKYIPIWML